MEFLKGLFEAKALTYEELAAAVNSSTEIKLVNLKDGQYIGKGKYESEKRTRKELEREVNTLKSGLVSADRLQKEIFELQKEIEKRNLEDENRKIESSYLNRFDRISSGAPFVNDITRKGIFEEFKCACSAEENSGKSDKEIYESLTKDRKGIFANKMTRIDMPVINQNTDKTAVPASPLQLKESGQEAGDCDCKCFKGRNYFTGTNI